MQNQTNIVNFHVGSTYFSQNMAYAICLKQLFRNLRNNCYFYTIFGNAIYKL